MINLMHTHQLRINTFIIWLIILLNANSLFAKPTINLSIDHFSRSAVCDAGISNAIVVGIRGRTPIVVSLPELYSTNIVSSSIVCELLIYQLKNSEGWYKRNIELFFEPLSDLEGSLWRETSGELLKFCLEKGLCSRGVIDFFSIDKSLRECHNGIDSYSLIKRASPKFLKKTLSPINQVKILIHPFDPFTKIVKNMIENDKTTNIYASTMTLGGRALKDLADTASNYHKNFHLLYDAGLSTFDEGLNQLPLLAKNSKYFFPVPITSGRDFSNIYHIKFAVSPEITDSYITGANLSTSSATEYLDVTYGFNDPLIRDELLYLAEKIKSEQCKAKKDIRCLSTILPDSHNQNEVYKAFINKSCSEKSHKIYNNHRHFATQKEFDIEGLIVNFINKAKNEIILVSHKLSSSEVSKALKRATKRGVKTYIVIAFPSEQLTKQKVLYYTAGEKELYPYPHIKSIIIDNKKMLFGSGNFTENALYNAAEIFAITNDVNAIKTIRDLFSNFIQNFDMDLSLKLSSKPKSENWIILTSYSQSSPLKFTEKADKPWMERYLKVQKKGVKILESCGLGHLTFIPDTTYRKCLEKF